MKPWIILLATVILVGGLLAVARVPLTYNLRNLVVRWRVTVMTALAFTLVVALLTVMLAFVNGMYRLTDSSGHPENVIVLDDGATDELFSHLSREKVGNIAINADATPRVLKDRDKPMVSYEVYIVVNQPVPVKEGQKPRRRFVQVRGVDDPVMSGLVHGLELYPGGKRFSGSGIRPNPDKGEKDIIEGVLGEGIARDLGRDRGKERLEVGDTFPLGDRTWVVTGIMKSLGSTFGSEIWAKWSLVGPQFGKEATYTAIVLKTKDPASAQELAGLLTRNFKDAAVQCQPEDEYYAKLSTTNQQFLYAIVFVAVIMSVGGVFGVMNTMFAAISQRTRDIGVLRILGYAPWQVLVSFFIESLWIALLGGALGCALGWLADGYTASSIVSGGQGGGKSVVFKLIVDANIIGAGMLFTLAMGALGGFLPSLSAMRLKPLDAIR